jgi:hypothetical protein
LALMEHLIQKKPLPEPSKFKNQLKTFIQFKHHVYSKQFQEISNSINHFLQIKNSAIFGFDLELVCDYRLIQCKKE